MSDAVSDGHTRVWRVLAGPADDAARELLAGGDVPTARARR